MLHKLIEERRKLNLLETPDDCRLDQMGYIAECILKGEDVHGLMLDCDRHHYHELNQYQQQQDYWYNHYFNELCHASGYRSF